MWFFRFCFCVNLESQYSHLFSFLTFMDCSNMHFQNPITSKNGVTRVTFKWCFSFKNWHNIFFSSVLVRTSIIAITLIFHLHEQMQYGSPDYVYKKIYHHNYHIWMAFFLHELKQNEVSIYLFENRCSCNAHIWMVSFLHELKGYVCSIAVS